MVQTTGLTYRNTISPGRGDGMVTRDIPPPLPGLAFLFGTDPVVGTTGSIPASLRDCSRRRALQELIGIHINGRDDVFRQWKFVERFAHNPAQAHDRFAAHQDVKAELPL